MKNDKILRAAVVLFGKSDFFGIDFPQCRLRVARFQGTQCQPNPSPFWPSLAKPSALPVACNGIAHQCEPRGKCALPKNNFVFFVANPNAA